MSYNKLMLKNKNQSGFIPLIICMIIVLGAVIWVSFKHVSDVHKAQDAVNKLKTTQQTVQQNENLINR